MKTATSIMVHSSAFGDGQSIPERYTGDAENISPQLDWDELPKGAAELALIVDDPDAPTPQPFVHWVIYHIPATAKGLPEGIPRKSEVADPPGAVQGKNSFMMGSMGYRGPAPPKGHGVHHYHFHLYALDAPVNLKAGADKPKTAGGDERARDRARGIGGDVCEGLKGKRWIGIS